MLRHPFFIAYEEFESPNVILLLFFPFSTPNEDKPSE